MTANKLRTKYLEFFKSKGHKIIPSASLIPENDPTGLFINSGMHPLVPYLLGESHPLGKRLANAQKCLRTIDISEVGDSTHSTFFEMLGNWSLGDYFKKEAIAWSFEFLTGKDWLGIPVGKLAVSVFAGDRDAPRDRESAEIWQSLGIPKERIAYLPKSDNWWGPAGQTGPCGPDTEMFYWKSNKTPAPKHFDARDNNWVEIWNDVFMQYNKQADGSFIPLKQQNVDTGLGLERVLAILNGKKTIYETELFEPIIKKITEIARLNQPNPEQTKAIRIIGDHLKAASFILGDEKRITPSNVEQGYILRRLIRRAVRYGRSMGITEHFTVFAAKEVLQIYQDVYPELRHNQEFILEELTKEEHRFAKTLQSGLKQWEKINRQAKDRISGAQAFYLYESFGFPLEMTKELAQEKGLSFDEPGFFQAQKKHQDLSRRGAGVKFKGGLADHTEETKRLHTATHLLHQALREILAEQVLQKGSNITGQRLRFDFSYSKPLTHREIKLVEDLVNKKIKANLAVVCQEMTPQQAKKQGAIGLFAHKYGERVKVYSINDFSQEICAGPHTEQTGQLGQFKIIKQEASSAGVRRIKAILVGKSN